MTSVHSASVRDDVPVNWGDRLISPEGPGPILRVQRTLRMKKHVLVDGAFTKPMNVDIDPTGLSLHETCPLRVPAGAR